MAVKEGYDVLRLIEHGQTCYISSEYVKGKILAGWLKAHPKITKERLFLLIRDITNQLSMIHKCRKKPYYQYVNPYSIIVTDEGEVYFLDLEAGSNEGQLRLMQKRAVREAFLPDEEPYYQKASLKLDIYGLGKTIQFLLAVTDPIPALYKREERKFLRIISRCLNDHSRLSYKNISEIRRSIPRYIQRTRPIRKRKKKFFFLCAAMCVLLAAWKILELRDSVSTIPEDPAPENGEGEILMSDVRDLHIELAMLYILYAEDYEKSLHYLKEIKNEYVAVGNLRAVAEALLGDKKALMELEMKPETDMRELENSISEDQVVEYYRCLIKGYALLDTEQAARAVLSLGEVCLDRMEDHSTDETEIKQYMALASEKVDRLEEAAHIYEELLEDESDDRSREKLYQKIAGLYEGCGMNREAVDVCTQGIEELKDSENLKIAHIGILCRDSSEDRVFCAQVIKEYLIQEPGLLENEEFQKLQSEYEIQAEGEEVSVGR